MAVRKQMMPIIREADGRHFSGFCFYGTLKENYMSNYTVIGLDAKKSEVLSKGLNELLANYAIFYQNVRGYHWNIQGEKFFELHLKFEELYNDLLLKIDEVAERILTLGGHPAHAYSYYAKISSIQESKQISDGKKAIKDILNSFSAIILLQRKIMKLSAAAEDEGTTALMSDYIRAQEKLVWMYGSFMKA